MFVVVFFFKQKTAYEMRISDWSSDVFSSDLIETDKATMEFEAIDEGTISRIAIPEGAEGVKVGTVIAELTEEGESSAAKPAKREHVASNGKAPEPESDRTQKAKSGPRELAATSEREAYVAATDEPHRRENDDTPHC